MFFCNFIRKIFAPIIKTGRQVLLKRFSKPDVLWFRQDGLPALLGMGGCLFAAVGASSGRIRCGPERMAGGK
ncbi:MAG: hypothetical protein K2N02_01190, partial [Alistipes sp.]|nr:hypothetical protein [Alistipes sp.]